MESYSLITSLVTGFGLALPFGFFAERFLRSPALVGYILAGVAAGIIPGLPPVNSEMLGQLAEIGVMLLMFGVGLHFSVRDLLRVRELVVPGAVIQMTVVALLGAAVARSFWEWNFGASVLFGFTIACASTVVVTKALEIRRMTNELNGQVAIGWLVVQDLASVALLVCLPPFAQAIQGEAVSASAVALDVVKTLAWAAVFVVLMLLIGRKVLPRLLREAALTGSRELFTLTVLGCAIVIAYGAGAIFDVSFALGAFFAGMVMQESRYAHRAAKDSLPLQDAFSVLFFVSVGMMLDWHVFLQKPWEIFTVVLLIIAGEMLIASTIVVLLRWPLPTALTVGACLGQIGEFSYILAAQGISLKLVDSSMMSLIVAASIVTIAFNPVLFLLTPRIQRFLTSRWAWARRSAMRAVPFETLPEDAPRELLDGQIVVIGCPSEGTEAFFDTFVKARRRTIVICGPGDPAEELRARGFGVLMGNPADPEVLVQAHVLSAGVLVIASAPAASARAILETVRTLNKAIPVVIRVKTLDDASLLADAGEGVKVLCEPLLTSLTVAAVALSELLGREDGDAEEASAGVDSGKRSVQALVDGEYRASLAQAQNAAAQAAPPQESGDALQAAAVRVADEAMSAVRRGVPKERSLREAARSWGRRAAGFFGRRQASGRAEEAEDSSDR